MSEDNTIRIVGKKQLEGEVRISSSKNAAVALIPACVMGSDVITLFDVPHISDIAALKELLAELNIKVERNGDSLIVDPREIRNTVLESEAVGKLRASYYFMGALLGRYKKVKMKMPGGCDLGPRPINLHLKGFRALGAQVNYDDGFYTIEAPELVGTEIYLDIASVGATINIMMAAVFAKGRTVIENAAREPEIIDLSTMLNKMGADIRGAGTNSITINGVERLHGCMHEIIPDRIEAGTYIIIAAACAKQMRITNIIPQHLEALTMKLDEMGVNMEIGDDYIDVFESKDLKGIDIKTLPYPGLATDLQQPLTALMTQAVGVSKVRETIYKERFKHCAELNKMGAEIEVFDGSSIINGPTPLFGTEVRATDLRCGASLVIAGLIAKGETTINDAKYIYRGYDHIKDKLRALGAEIY
ncbi:MAG: UDP-N-acetylglucosamine 1-carboxyvinyltransferase [Erysipelotrichaceae bacterium]|nr:UDP-N-acetylglucosamine 1-carboxyvinyltransferase [Erysipelotrichaceae bacterium]